METQMQAGLFQHRSTFFNLTCTAVCTVLDGNLEEMGYIEISQVENGSGAGQQETNRKFLIG